MTGGSAPAPGWYADPANSSLLRYWDGTQWTNTTSAAQPAPPAQAQGWGQPAPPAWGASMGTPPYQTYGARPAVTTSQSGGVGGIVRAAILVTVWSAVLLAVVSSRPEPFPVTGVNWGLLLFLGAGNLICLVMIPKLITQRGKFHSQTNGVLAVVLVLVMYAVSWAMLLAHPRAFGVRLTGPSFVLIFMLIAVYKSASDPHSRRRRR